MKKVYIAGALFKDGDIKERKFEGKVLREKGLNVFNPIEAPFNKDKNASLPTSKTIFENDTHEVLTSDYIFAEYDHEDPGVMAEMGIAWAISHIHDLAEAGESLEDILKKYPRKKIIAHNSDIRLSSADKYKGHYIPVGLNQYIVGLIEDQGKIFTSKEKAFNEIKK